CVAEALQTQLCPLGVSRWALRTLVRCSRLLEARREQRHADARMCGGGFADPALPTRREPMGIADISTVQQTPRSKTGAAARCRCEKTKLPMVLPSGILL
ncbi:MAG: hypothetical protein IJ906_14270, partial [Oscillospiraceae bacterium]|nr:hypothetical protein [Oscillospiraceae bacterium]